MPQPNQAALDFLLSRRSRPAKTLQAPAPDRAALDPILTAGLRSPDHGKLEPWRLIVLDQRRCGGEANPPRGRPCGPGTVPMCAPKNSTAVTLAFPPYGPGPARGLPLCRAGTD